MAAEVLLSNICARFNRSNSIELQCYKLHLRQAQKRWLFTKTLTKAGLVEKIFGNLKKICLIAKKFENYLKGSR